ncbi:MAG: hypothetical protein K0U37_07045 [Gammaproteobacteria bacterium]|nr:hypothetical protein [Gammaproteobacteria bacterium]
MKVKSKTKSQAIKRKLSAEEIYERSFMIKETEERIPSEEEVYKVGNQHVLVRGSETHQLITSATKRQRRLVFYSGEAVLPQEQVLGLGNRHHPAYVQRDGKHIPVYTKNNFGRFIFLYPDGTHVSPRTPLELTVKGDVFTERDGERVFLKRQRAFKKNTLPMFSDIVEPLPTYWKAKRTASLVSDDQNESDEEAVGQDMEAMSDAIAKEAAPVLVNQANQANVTPTRMPVELTNDFSPGTLLLLSEFAESLSPSAEGNNDALEGGSAENILEEDITLSSIPKEAERKRKRHFLVKETGEFVPDEADVYKVGRRYRWLQGEESRQVIVRETKTQGRYLLYSGEAVLPQEQILGFGNRHHPTYIQKDGKKIPVYRKSYLRKFIFLYPDGTHVPPETPLELVDKVQVVAERNGEQVLLRKHRIPDKSTLSMFSNIVEPLVSYHQGKEAVEAENEGCRTPLGTIKESEQVFSLGTLSLFADASVVAESENVERNWVDSMSVIETCEI